MGRLTLTQISMLSNTQENACMQYCNVHEVVLTHQLKDRYC